MYLFPGSGGSEQSLYPFITLSSDKDDHLLGPAPPIKPGKLMISRPGDRLAPPGSKRSSRILSCSIRPGGAPFFSSSFTLATAAS